MREAKNTQRALVRIGFDGRVHKLFRGPEAETRFANEVRVLRYLEKQKCPFVPRLLDSDETKLEIVTSNCGSIVQHLSEERAAEVFAELEKYGVRHEDPYARNVTYRATDGKFCAIDFEFATILGEDETQDSATESAAVSSAKSIKWSGQTDRGRFRPNNEDAFLAMLLDDRGVRYLGKNGEANLEGADFIFAVSDGMGGEKSGEFASRIAIEKITLLLPRQFGLSAERFQGYRDEILGRLFSSIHAAMLDLGKYDPNCQDMGATLTLAWFRGGHMFFGHIGDSRLYHLPADGEMRQVTDDHTHVGWLRRSGKINEREARMHPRKNVLAQALGAGHKFLQPHFGTVEYQPGDKFLLCTDGVIEGLWDRRIEALVREDAVRDDDTVRQGAVQEASETSKAAALVSYAVKESGRDNATAVIVEAN